MRPLPKKRPHGLRQSDRSVALARTFCPIILLPFVLLLLLRLATLVVRIFLPLTILARLPWTILAGMPRTILVGLLFDLAALLAGIIIFVVHWSLLWCPASQQKRLCVAHVPQDNAKLIWIRKIYQSVTQRFIAPRGRDPRIVLALSNLNPPLPRMSSVFD
jgi:hypothetical protein